MKKLTLFEMHFDGAQIGSPNPTREEAQSAGGAEEIKPTSSSAGRRLPKLLVASVILAIIAAVTARRLGNRGTDFDSDADVEEISVEPIEA